MLTFSAINYVNGVRAVESALRGSLSHDVSAFASDVDASLKKREQLLATLAKSDVVRAYLTRQRGDSSSKVILAGIGVSNTGSERATNDVPMELRSILKSFYLLDSKSLIAITVIDPDRKPLLRAAPAKGAGELATEPLQFQTKDFLPNNFPLSESVWTTADEWPLRSAITHNASGSVVRYTCPVFLGVPSPSVPRGVILYEVSLDATFHDAAGVPADTATIATAEALKALPARNLLVLDANQLIIFHTNEALAFQRASTAMPAGFKPIADAMTSGQVGTAFFQAPGGVTWLAAYGPVWGKDVSVAALAPVDSALHGLRREAWLSLVIAAYIGGIMAILSSLVLRRTTHSIERVTAGAVAIAAGDLNQRIEVTSSDETKLLAESFNQMTDRLKEQIAREAESRQFESFMRLSAMLTHDLKNAIAGLSLLVGNMEKQFHREDFRRDAMHSLLESTAKLRALVSKLSGPVQSLSGEHERPRPMDLVPLIGRVLTTHAAPRGELFVVATHLPEHLMATAEPERIEKVIENLVVNALEAMEPNGGTLKIEGGETENKAIFFTISDTGPGMTEEFQKNKLFRAFSTTKRHGVGLGLYTCREVVKAHGGYIDVESKRNAGTTFRVVLPSG